MTIQVVNLNPIEQGGDTRRSAFKKLSDNFADNNNAASRLVGNLAGQVSVCDDKNAIKSKSWLGDGGWIFLAESNGQANSELAGYSMKASFGGNVSDRKPRRCADIVSGFSGAWGSEYLSLRVGKGGTANDADNLCDERIVITSDSTTLRNKLYAVSVYNATTAIGANVAIADNGQIMRSTSSERYKKDIQPIELDDKTYAAIRQVKPISYKSTAEADNPNHTFQSFSAEELAKASPSLVFWEYEETVKDANTGEIVTRKLPQRRPAGLNLNGIAALQHAFALKQAELIDTLTKQIKDLTKRVAVLETTGVTK